MDPNIAAAADSTVMMPWQGQQDNLIDRFDVRAHLDYIPIVKKEDESELSQEERQLNYERYRIIAQNSFLGISEEKFLKQLHLEEQYGYTESKAKKEQKTGGAAIGFNYEDGTGKFILMYIRLTLLSALTFFFTFLNSNNFLSILLKCCQFINIPIIGKTFLHISIYINISRNMEAKNWDFRVTSNLSTSGERR